MGQVSKTANTSRFYFCKLFRQFTAVTFTEFLARTRIDQAKHLLLNPNLRVSEIAFDIGFQSLGNFNRVFKQLVGQSPSDYRDRLPALT